MGRSFSLTPAPPLMELTCTLSRSTTTPSTNKLTSSTKLTTRRLWRSTSPVTRSMPHIRYTTNSTRQPMRRWLTRLPTKLLLRLPPTRQRHTREASSIKNTWATSMLRRTTPSTTTKQPMLQNTQNTSNRSRLKKIEWKLRRLDSGSEILVMLKKFKSCFDKQ